MKYSKTKKLKIVSIESGEELGEVKRIIIDHNNGNFLGLFLKNKNIIHAEDIGKFGEDAVMVQSEKELMPLKDNSEFEEIIKAKIRIIGNKVVTQSGVELGEVKDYEVSEERNKLYKIFVSTGFLKDLFKGELIITEDKIISIGKDAIVVKDTAIPAKEKEKVRKEVENLARVGALNKDLE